MFGACAHMSLTATLDRPWLSSPRHRSCSAFLRSVSSIPARWASLPYGGRTMSSRSPEFAISRVASSLASGSLQKHWSQIVISSVAWLTAFARPAMTVNSPPTYQSPLHPEHVQRSGRAWSQQYHANPSATIAQLQLQAANIAGAIGTPSLSCPPPQHRPRYAWGCISPITSRFGVPTDISKAYSKPNGGALYNLAFLVFLKRFFKNIPGRQFC